MSVNSLHLEEKLTWFREILEFQDDATNAEEFMESLKIDLFSDMVFIFTPKGDVIELPSGSNPIDFAYRIHSEIGNKTIGAKVNGKMVPLDYKLKTGDIIEILTSKHSYGPSQDWLKLTQTSQAKNKIRQFFKKQRREENIEKGKELVEKEIKDMEFDLKEILAAENIKRVADKFNFLNEEDMYAAVGYNGITALQVANRLTEKWRKQKMVEQEADISEAVADLKTFSNTSKKRTLVYGYQGLITCLSAYHAVAIRFQGMKSLVILPKAVEFQFIGKTARTWIAAMPIIALYRLNGKVRLTNARNTSWKLKSAAMTVAAY